MQAQRRIDSILRTVVVICCLAFPLTILVYLLPDEGADIVWVQAEFYYVLVGATIGLAFLAFYFAYKEFHLSGNAGIQLLSLSYLFYSLLLFEQSLLSGHVQPILADSFSTHARLVFSIFFMMGVLASSQSRAFEKLRGLSGKKLNWLTAGTVALAALYGVALRSGLGVETAASMEPLLLTMNSALNMAAVTFLAVAVLSLYVIYSQRQNPMALVLALGAGFTIESTLFFSLSSPWKIMWWAGHGVVVLGLIVMTYGIVLITHTRESDQLLFDLQFSRKELERARSEQAALHQNLEQLQFVVTVADTLRHEILNPHTVIHGNAQILLRGSLTGEQREQVEGIARQSQKVIELMDRYRSLRQKVEVQEYQEGATKLIDLDKSR